MTRDRDLLAESMIPVAAALAVAVDEEDSDLVHDLVTTLTRNQLNALVVVLAAHVDPDQPFQRTEGRPGITKQAARKAADAFGVHTTKILSDDRHRPVAEARIVTYYAAHLLGQNFSEIGRAMNRDHTTVLAGCTRAGQMPRLRTIATRIAVELGYDREDGVA